MHEDENYTQLVRIKKVAETAVVWSTRAEEHPRFFVHAVREDNGYIAVIDSYAVKADAIRRAEEFWAKCYGFSEVRVVRFVP